MAAVEVSEDWERTIAAFLRELETAGASPNTIRAYVVDLRELGAWATGLRRPPGDLRYRDLRGYARALSERGLARATVARKLAAIRSLGAHLVRSGVAAQNPAELLRSPKRDSRLPRVLGPDEAARLLDRIPATGPARGARPRDAGAHLCMRPARRRDPRHARRRRRLRVRVRPRPREGREGAHGADRGAGSEGASAATSTSLVRPSRAVGTTNSRCSCRSEAAPFTRPTSGGGSSAGFVRRGSREASRHTSCATRSRPTCSRAEPTCARSRSCSAIRASRPRRSTRGWSRGGCGASTQGPIRVPEHRPDNVPDPS